MRYLAIIASLLLPTVAQGANNNVQTSVGADFSTIGHYRTDSDFDPTERYYDTDGQSSGQLASFLRTRLGLEKLAEGNPHLSLLHEMELGWNAWGGADPSQPDAFNEMASAGLNLRHRQLWAQVALSSHTSLKAGFQEIKDPSGLFLDHLGGGFTLTVRGSGSETSILAGQLPEQTLEGVSIGDDNFVTDSLVAGGHVKLVRAVSSFDLAAYLLHDERAIDRPIDLATVVAGFETKLGATQLWMHALGQYGKWANSGIGGIDQNISSWATQLGMTQPVMRGSWSLRALVLSGDDAYDGNNHLGAFLGSGKNRSASKILTEDENRDRYDNLDERMATNLGSLFLNTAGLAVIDGSIVLPVNEDYAQSMVIAGGWNLNPDNAMGHQFVGTELEWTQTWTIQKDAALFVTVQIFQPGKAAAVFVNDVDRTATEAVYGAQLGFQARF